MLFNHSEYMHMYKNAALQEPSSMGHPRKCFGHLNPLQQLPTHYLLGSNFSAFAPLGSLKYFLGNSLDLWTNFTDCGFYCLKTTSNTCQFLLDNN